MLSLVGSSSSRVLRKRLLTNSTYQGASALFHSTPHRSQADQAAPIRRKKPELSPESKDKVKEIFQKILWLDMIEVHLVTELVNQKLGLVLSPKQHDALQKVVDQQLAAENGETSDAASTESKEEEVAKTVDLKLTGFDAKSKIKVIKEVRAIAGLGLKEAKELVEGFPKTIQKDLKPEQAEELKEKLEAVGAQIELV